MPCSQRDPPAPYIIAVRYLPWYIHKHVSSHTASSCCLLGINVLHKTCDHRHSYSPLFHSYSLFKDPKTNQASCWKQIDECWLKGKYLYVFITRMWFVYMYVVCVKRFPITLWCYCNKINLHSPNNPSYDFVTIRHIRILNIIFRPELVISKSQGLWWDFIIKGDWSSFAFHWPPCCLFILGYQVYCDIQIIWKTCRHGSIANICTINVVNIQWKLRIILAIVTE